MGKKIIVDSDLLVALFKPDDSSHKNSIRIVKIFRKEKAHFAVLKLVLFESVTVISNKMGMQDARNFYTGLTAFTDEIIDFNDQLEKMTWSIFLSQTKKGTSFIDCANVAVMDHYKFDGILSFDRFYGKKRVIQSP